MIPLLMTASISTHGMVGACFSDEERLEMYRETLIFYLKKLKKFPQFPIVFVDNSGFDLSKLQNDEMNEFIDYQKIEFISLPQEKFDISKGKGYNEAKLISLAINSSEFIKNSGRFMKVTGRYPLYNVLYFLKNSEKFFNQGIKLYCDIKDHKLYDWLGNGWCGHSFCSKIYSCSIEFWEDYIKPDIEELNDYQGFLIENLLFRNCRHVNLPKILRFKREPQFGGLEGSNIDAISFSKNQDSLKTKSKRLIGNFIRTFLPWFWF